MGKKSMVLSSLLDIEMEDLKKRNVPMKEGTSEVSITQGKMLSNHATLTSYFKQDDGLKKKRKNGWVNNQFLCRVNFRGVLVHCVRGSGLICVGCGCLL